MNEKPIIFSGESVRAILADHKTQTRRVIQPQPVQDPDRSWRIEMRPRTGYNSEKTMRNYLPNRCPYGQPGSHLWVRETWAHDDLNCKDVTCGNRDHIWWKANEKKIVADSFAGDAHWSSPIYMPRWASRIDLQIENVRVERLWEISDTDIKAEGIVIKHGSVSSHFDSFMLLWNEINAKRGYPWSGNWWIWVIEFKRADPGTCSLGYDMTEGDGL